jgi:hypothetical protein
MLDIPDAYTVAASLCTTLAVGGYSYRAKLATEQAAPYEVQMN